MHPLLDRLGVDSLSGRMSRLREDERFKAVGPDAIVLPYPTPADLHVGLKPEHDGEGEIWFDWAFIDFWKSNYCSSPSPSIMTPFSRFYTDTIQRGFTNDPNSLSSSSGM